MAPILSATLRTLRTLPGLRRRRPADDLPGLAATLVRRLAAALQARRNRRAFAALAGWDDHMLADIGLNRSTVAGALEAGFLQDPSRIVTEGSRHPPEAGEAEGARAAPPAMPAGCWAY